MALLLHWKGKITCSANLSSVGFSLLFTKSHCFWCVSKPNSVTVICTLTRPAVQIPTTQYKPRASVQPGYRGAPRKVYLSHLIHPIIQTLGRRRRRRHQRRGTLFDSASTFQSSRYRKRSAWGLYSDKAYMPFSRWGEKNERRLSLQSDQRAAFPFSRKQKPTFAYILAGKRASSAAPVTPLPKS